MIPLKQWFSNCGTRTTSGTRRPSGWYAKRPAFCFSSQKYIHSCSFYLSGSVNKFLNFCVAYFPCCFLIMAIKISHSHFVHVGFVSILVFQTFDRMIFGTLTFHGTREGGMWWQYGTHKWYVIRKSLRTTALKPIQNLLEQWFLTCGEFPTGGNGGVAKCGMTGRTLEPLLQNLTHNIRMLTYFTNHNHSQTIVITKTTNIWGIVSLFRTKHFTG